MTGRRPHHSNVMGTGTGQSFRVSGTDRSGLPGANWTTCPQHFRESGWLTLGGGKTFHPNDPPHFDQPFSWSADLPYYDFTCTPLNTPPPPASSCRSLISTERRRLPDLRRQREEPHAARHQHELHGDLSRPVRVGRQRRVLHAEGGGQRHRQQPRRSHRGLVRPNARDSRRGTSSSGAVSRGL